MSAFLIDPTNPDPPLPGAHRVYVVRNEHGEYLGHHLDFRTLEAALRHPFTDFVATFPTEASALRASAFHRLLGRRCRVSTLVIAPGEDAP